MVTQPRDVRLISGMPPRRFDACFIVRDTNRQALACVYFEGEPRARGGEVPHPDVALAYATPS